MPVDHPVQKAVLRLHRQPGDLQRSGLGDLIPLPFCHNARHLDPVANRVEVGQLGLGDLHGLRHMIPDAAGEILAGTLPRHIGLGQLVRFLRQQGLCLDPLPVGLNDCSQLHMLIHSRENEAGDLCPAVCLAESRPLERCQAVMAGDQSVPPALIRDHRQRLQEAVGLNARHQIVQIVHTGIEIPGIGMDVRQWNHPHRRVRIGHLGQLIIQDRKHIHITPWHCDVLLSVPHIPPQVPGSPWKLRTLD